MNINKITQKMYIDYFTESKCNSYSEFIENKLKSHESKCECIINCYMLFTLDDWSHITSLKLFQELILQYPHFSTYKIICESHYNLLKEIQNSHILNRNKIDEVEILSQKLYDMYSDDLNNKNGKINYWIYDSNSGV